MHPTHPDGYTQPPGFREFRPVAIQTRTKLTDTEKPDHNWNTPARERCAGLRTEFDPDAHRPFKGAPTGSRQRPSQQQLQQQQQQQQQKQQQQQSRVALPSQSSSSPGASASRAGGTRHPTTEPGYFDLASLASALPPPEMQAHSGDRKDKGKGKAAQGQEVVSPPAEPSSAASASTNFGYYPMMSPYEAEAASGKLEKNGKNQAHIK